MQSTSSPTAPHLPTPNLSHLSSGQDYANVYEPAEDSFLLLDVLEADQTLLLETVRPQLCLEVGSGSGVVSTFLAGQVLRTDSPPTDYNGTATLYVATDINPDAARATRKTWLQNGLPDHSLQLVNTQFTEGFHPRFCGTFDVVVFNPPYVVTDPAEVGSHSIAAAWAGGIDGREVIDQFLPMIPTLLSPRGVCYLVLIAQNRPDEVVSIMETHGLRGEIVAKRKAGIEYLSIARFSWP